MSKTYSEYGREPSSFLPSPERTSRSRRRDAAHDERQQRKRGANDTSLRPVTEDLISNLLGSFSSISRNTEDTVPGLPTPYDYSPRYSLTRDTASRLSPVTTTKTSRRSSFSLPFRDGFRPSFASRIPSTQTEANAAQTASRPECEDGQQKQKSERNSPTGEEDDSALPPIVRMSRSSSTRARKPLQKFSKRQVPLGSRSSSGSGTQNPHVGYGNGNSVAVERRDKGKRPIYQVTVNAPPRTNAHSVHSNGVARGYDGPAPPPRTSSRSARSSIGDGVYNNRRTSMGRSASLNMTAMQSIHDESRRAATLDQASLRSIENELRLLGVNQPIDIPDRTTSLHRIIDSPVRRRRSQKAMETGIDEYNAAADHRIANYGSKTPTQEDYYELHGSEPPSLRQSEVSQSTSGDESDAPSVIGHRRDVMRRIAELKAASQARLGSLDRDRYHSATVSRQASDEHMDFVPPLPMLPPDTSLANGQLAQAQRLHEYVVEDSNMRPTSGLTSSYSDRSITSVRNTTTLEMQRVPRPGTIGIISTSSSRAPSIDSVRTSRGDESTVKPSRRLSRWSLSGPRPQTPLLDTLSRTSSVSQAEARTILQTTKPIVVTTPAPPEPKHNPDSIEEDIAAFLRSPRLSQSVIVDEGQRRITFSEIGDPKGHAVLCFVGMGMTRYVTAFYDELATSLKLRIITPDRPGIGDSEPYAGGSRRPVDWPGKSLHHFLRSRYCKLTSSR